MLFCPLHASSTLNIKCHNSLTTAAILKNGVVLLFHNRTASTPTILASDRHGFEDLRRPAHYVRLLDVHSDVQGSPTAYRATHFLMDNTNGL